MKFEHNPKYTTIAIYALIVIFIAMIFSHAVQSIHLVFGFFGKVMGFLTPIIYGVVFAFLLNPLLRNIEKRILDPIFHRNLKPAIRRVIGMVLTYLVAAVFIGLFIAIVLPQILSSMLSIMANVPSYIKSFSLLFTDLSNWMDGFVSSSMGTDPSGLTTEFATKLRESLGSLLSSMYMLLERSVGTLISITTSLTTGILNLLLGIFVSIYILMDREKLFAQCKKIGCALFTKDFYALVYDILQDVNRIFSGFVIGKVIDSIIIGILCMIGMSVLGLPYPTLISVIVGVTNVIPYFGPIIGAIPGFFIIVIISPVQSLWFLIFIFLLQQLDGNVIGPKILGDTIGLSPLWIIFSIMLFSGLMGVLGMFIGVPVFALLYSLSKRFVAYLLRKKGQSTSTRDYASDKNPLIK